MSDMLDDLIKATGNEYIKSLQEKAETEGYLDTGSYLLNAQLSGNIFGGIPRNKVTVFAGEQSTGKCARGTEIIEIYMSEDVAKKLNLDGL